MRTTLDIDDEVLEAVKEIARRRHSTAGTVLSELARRALTSAADRPTSIAEPPGFYGFRPLPAGDRVVGSELAERIREEDGI